MMNICEAAQQQQHFGKRKYLTIEGSLIVSMTGSLSVVVVARGGRLENKKIIDEN